MCKNLHFSVIAKTTSCLILCSICILVILKYVLIGMRVEFRLSLVGVRFAGEFSLNGRGLLAEVKNAGGLREIVQLPTAFLKR